jgi:hypothetical protein
MITALRLLSVLFLALIALPSVLPARAADSPAVLEARLETAGVQPTEEGVRKYLESLLDPAAARDADALVVQLGDDAYEIRERASQRLASMAFVPLDKLEAATKSADAEVRLRAKKILDSLRKTEGTPLAAALALVEQKRLAVGVPLLVKIRDQATASDVQEAAVRAMLAIVQESDRKGAEALVRDADKGRRNAGRRLLARLEGPAVAAKLEGTFEAVQLTPGNVAGGGADLLCGWQFKALSNVTVTHLGIYDRDANGLAAAHEVAIWDIDDAEAPVAQETIAAGEEVPLTGLFRYVATRPVKLAAGKSYAIVALYPNPSDTTVSMINPSGLKIEYAAHLEAAGRRYSFPHKAMAFPGNHTPDPKNCSIGPTFRFEVTDEGGKESVDK